MEDESRGPTTTASNSVSPTSNGTGSTATTDFEALKRDPKYKRYVNAIDAILKLFDAVSEWADVIGFLSKLLKTLQMHSQYSNVPRKLIVSKRLAQCLNPALPSGVHQKTLEVYQAIFEAAGPAQLAEDLPLWSYGLFPFFQNAAMSVKPVLLQLYERYYLTLGMHLKPCLKGLILALLPGLEEEGNEFFDPVLRMLDKLMESVGTPYFFHCLSLAAVSGVRVRGAALNYLLRRCPKFGEKRELVVIMGTDTLVVCRALASALEDKQILVQRSALELLVVHFPLQKMLFSENEVEVIIRAAIGVVLRKDMSLNRRLYSWLLGTANKLETASRDSLINTVRNMLWSSSDDIHELTRPYRIIISLMDKDEIGSAMLDQILMDIFKSLKEKSLVLANYKELLQSAEMLLDSINPYTIWKHIYHLVIANPIGPCQTMQEYELLDFMLGIVRVEEEDVKRIHLPILLYWLSYQLDIFKKSDDFTENSHKLPLFLGICSKVLSKIPRESMTKSWILKPSESNRSERIPMQRVESRKAGDKKASPTSATGASDISISSFCSLLYGTVVEEAEETALDEPAVFQSPYISEFVIGRPVVELSFTNFQVFLTSLLDQVITFFGPGTVVDSVVSPTGVSVSNSEKYSIVMLLEETCRMIEVLASAYLEVHSKPKHGSLVAPEYEHWDWFLALSECVTQTSEFSVLNVSLSCVLQILLQARSSSVTLKFDVEQFIQVSVSRLWLYLDPEPFGIYHTRAVDLIWKLSSVTKFGSYIVENVVANFLSSRDLVDLLSHQQRFGILWRVIEPILATLLHPDIFVFSEPIMIGNQEETVFYYKREFNMGQVLYSMETLSLLLAGHRPLLQTLWSESVKEADFLELKDVSWLHNEFNTSLGDLKYAEILMFICLRFLRTEVYDGGAFHLKYEKLQAINTSIQSQSCEFISKFLGFSEVQSTMNTVVAKVLIHKITYSISVAQLDLQPRLLLVLSSLYENQEKLMLSHHSSMRRNSMTVGDALDNLIVSSREVLGLSASNSKLDEQVNSFETLPGFLQMVLGSLTQSSNRHVLQHWIDFILLILPRLNISFRSLLQPIISVICDQISLREKEMSVYVDWCKENFRNRGAIGAPDNDVVILVVALNRIVEFCLASDVNWNKSDIEKIKGGTNIWDFGIVSSVFVDSSSPDVLEQEPQNSRDAIIELLPGILGVLKSLFSLFKRDPFESDTSSSKSLTSYELSGASLDFLCVSVKTSIRHILQTIYSKFPAHLVESTLEVWFSDCDELVEGKAFTSDNSVLDMIHLVPDLTHKALMMHVLDGLRTRFGFAQNIASSKDKGNPFYVRSKQISDTHLLFFLEKYIVLFADPETVYEVWPSIHTHAKDCIPLPPVLNTNYFLPVLLKLVTVCIEKLILTKHFDDKRMRFHMDEIYQKLFDLTILYCAKPPEVPALTQAPATILPSLGSGLKQLQKPSITLISSDILLHLASAIIPHMRKLLLDQEKIIAVLTNLVYYLIGPNLKTSPNLAGGKFKPMLEVLAAVARLPFAVKTFKKEAWDAFMDSRFFDMHLNAFRMWKAIINSLANADKDLRISEIAVKISTVSSGSIFVSRDQELQTRIYAVRRLSFVLWSGTVDQYLPQLPLIQEKLVEILKGPSGPLHIEAYLCLRILMCRMTAHHLSNLWPIVLTELIQIFGVYLRDQGTKDDLQVFLSCCKLLELLLLLGTEEFQWHQWIFICEVFDFGGPESSNGTSLVDKLSLKWAVGGNERDDASSLRAQTSLRRPILTMHTVLDKQQLAPFISTLSHHTYSSTFTAAKPDMAFIEEVLEADIMDTDSNGSPSTSSPSPKTRVLTPNMSPKPEPAKLK
ncbi:hypothetical protein HDU79_009455 [Rhizoclosmatium sp. JEL0117]|nr:hypothetical protein HDU79_009455 [Rhizoclosmatium sp. JEL0117]